MFEIVFELSSLADTAVFYGINNSNMQLIKNLHPNLRIVARGNAIKIIGNQQDADKLIVNLQKLEKFSIDNNQLTEKNIIELIKGENPKDISFQNLIMHGVGGKSIFARTKNQQRLVEEFEKNDLLFAIGPAGSGKTYTAIALAVRALKNKQIKKIILSRPAVEAGEKLGFLPGDMKEKIDPYLQPLYDALQDMITPLKLKEYMENGTIQIAPLAFMRGRTLSDAVVILDEAQNSTIMQIKMFLTRMGLNTKMIVTGDITQIDLPRDQKSGLIDALNLLGNIKGIARIDFDVNDIVRHRLVQQIVQAYDNRAMNERQKNTKE
ncbi:MAG: PhoH family protein [Paludibacteraceae bacterium]|jgi:phosphate starvation-inducible PhoH-like protein|nr:PhoH family protein [Paludibacteraceae bacterium]OPZ02813.1 MAG: PhoH-like protein [Bacteroidetes bacterium ADurb.BinA395]HOF98148.1 PhoH family protein [Paludibacteraceae bacterium]HOJ66539.1 PhoH family protein [Paludibacteraceae bacterium]HOR39226.1 PhoH family protein [Paludibacteraceae bacterium]